MNLLLQDPFTVLKEYPEKLTYTIQNPLITTCLKYSPQGHYLALGSVNGSVMIYDTETYRPIHILGSQYGGAHSRAVQSIQWSDVSYCSNIDEYKVGRYIVTCGRDWYCRVWDILKPETPIFETLFNGPVWNCHWIPINEESIIGYPKLDRINQCLLATAYEESHAFYIDPINNINIPLKENDAANVSDDNHYEDEVQQGKDTKNEDHGFVLTTYIHPKLKNVVITGSSKGWIKFYNIESNNKQDFETTSSASSTLVFKILNSIKISNSNIKDIIISQNGDRMAINCSDRTIRQYSLTFDSKNESFILNLEHRYQDVINKLQWNGIMFSNKSGDYIVASTHGSSTHELYLWETNFGSLVRVLEGPEEELMDIDWNYYTMSIASNGFETGDVYIWSLVIPPKWSALAPDFEEIEENIDYQEKEDEFDEFDEDQNHQSQYNMINNTSESIPIDLGTKEKYDVRGNNITYDQCPIPIDYERIITMNYQNSLK